MNKTTKLWWIKWRAKQLDTSLSSIRRKYCLVVSSSQLNLLDSTQTQLKFQQVILWILPNTFQSLNRLAKDPKEPKQHWGGNIGGLTILSFKNYKALIIKDFPGGSDGKASVYNAGDPGLIPGSGRSPGEGNGNPLQYYCLENPMDRGAW